MNKVIWLACNHARDPIIAFFDRSKLADWLKNGPSARKDVRWIAVMEEGQYASTLPVWDVPAFLFDQRYKND